MPAQSHGCKRRRAESSEPAGDRHREEEGDERHVAGHQRVDEFAQPPRGKGRQHGGHVAQQGFAERMPGRCVAVVRSSAFDLPRLAVEPIGERERRERGQPEREGGNARGVQQRVGRTGPADGADDHADRHHEQHEPDPIEPDHDAIGDEVSHALPKVATSEVAFLHGCSAAHNGILHPYSSCRVVCAFNTGACVVAMRTADVYRVQALSMRANGRPAMVALHGGYTRPTRVGHAPGARPRAWAGSPERAMQRQQPMPRVTERWPP